MGQLIGMVDLLMHTKDLSLLQQTVNTLPWEVTEAEDEFPEEDDRPDTPLKASSRVCALTLVPPALLPSASVSSLVRRSSASPLQL